MELARWSSLFKKLIRYWYVTGWPVTTIYTDCSSVFVKRCRIIQRPHFNSVAWRHSMFSQVAVDCWRDIPRTDTLKWNTHVILMNITCSWRLDRGHTTWAPPPRERHSVCAVCSTICATRCAPLSLTLKNCTTHTRWSPFPATSCRQPTRCFFSHASASCIRL